MKTLALTGLALGLTVAGAGGWAAWNSTAIAHRDAAAGVMSVEVVAPREPDLPPGSIMAVGELQNGYVHDPARLQPPAILDAEYEAYLDDAWLELPATGGPAPQDYPNGLVWVSPRPATPVRLEPDDYSFGFDQPLPEQAGPTDRLAHVSLPDTVDSSPPWDERGLD